MREKLPRFDSGRVSVGTIVTNAPDGRGRRQFTLDAGGQVVGYGQINVSGTLRNNGDVQGLVVQNDGTPQGNGGSVLQSGAVLAPGNSVSGGSSLTFNGGSKLVFEFNNATGTSGGGIRFDGAPGAGSNVMAPGRKAIGRI